MAVNTWNYTKDKKIVESVFRDLQNQSILDAGCGNGDLAKIISEEFNSDFFLMDISNNLPLVKNSLNNKGVVLGSVEYLPFKDHSINTIFLKDVLHHLESPETAVQEILRVSNKNIVIIEANRYNPVMYLFWTKQREHEHFTRKMFYELMETSCKNLPYNFKKVSIDHSLHYLTIIPASIINILESSEILSACVFGIEKLIERLVPPLASFNVVVLQLIEEG